MITFSKKQAAIIQAPFEHTLEVNEGTPRSGKTLCGHFRYARYIVETQDENHLMVAYNQEQAYRLFVDGDGTGLKHIFGNLCEERDDKHGAHLKIYTPNGDKKIYYKGAGKANSVGAVTGMSLGSVNFGEINLLNMDMIQECFRRTFAAKQRFHMADLNPPAPHHPVISKVFDVQDTKWTHWTINDNPILTEKRKKEIYNTLIKNPYLYKRDWLGERVMPEGVIYSGFDMEENVWHTIQGKPIEMFFSGDGGQSDATSMGCYIVVSHDGKYKLLNVATYSHSGSETGVIKAMSTYAKELDEFIKYCNQKFQMMHTEIFIDPACKSLREELHLLGHATKGADNNSSDIAGTLKGLEVGIERLQSAIENRTYLIVECSERYDHRAFLVEIGMYVRADNGTPVDKYNHELDRSRYANNYFYKRYVR